jgi:hypothetical protein
LLAEEYRKKFRPTIPAGVKTLEMNGSDMGGGRRKRQADGDIFGAGKRQTRNSLDTGRTASA